MNRTPRLALATCVLGFLIEAATELYQFLSYGLNQPGWIGFYYLGLVTTVLGLYLIFLGRRDWIRLRGRRVYPGQQMRWASISMIVGAIVAVAGLGALQGKLVGVGPSVVLAWLVGGLIALAFGSFFLNLALLVDPLVRRLGRPIAWTAFAWSLGVGVVTGLLVGAEFPTLFREFFTNPLGLVDSSGVIAFVIAPLFVTYFLLAAAYADAYVRLPVAPDGPEPSVPPSTDPTPNSESTGSHRFGRSEVGDEPPMD